MPSKDCGFQNFPGFIVGIDLGGTRVAGILLSPDGVILAIDRKDVPVNVERRALVEMPAELVKRLSIASSGGVDAVEIGVPGPVEENGRVLPPVPNLPKVGRLPFARISARCARLPSGVREQSELFCPS